MQQALIVTSSRIMGETLALVVSGLAEYCVESAANGPAALSLIAEQRPDLILIDGRLPRPEMLSVISQGTRAAPRSCIALLMDPDMVDEEIVATGVEILPIYAKPAVELYEALARLACATSDPAHL
jgi:CheY-like chemotaxis protein